MSQLLLEISGVKTLYKIITKEVKTVTVKFYLDVDKIINTYGVSITQLADRANLDRSYMSKIKRGSPISLNTLSRIATALGEKDASRLLSVQE
ncbi:helix-turn-helix transcriptional regulator [Bacillus cereus]|nr:helix-turn-helix transcriptional regulator [Bacillus cereus]